MRYAVLLKTYEHDFLIFKGENGVGSSKTSDETAGDEETEKGRGDLGNDTEHEDTASWDDGGTTTDAIGERTCEGGTEHSTDRQDGGDE